MKLKEWGYTKHKPRKPNDRLTEKERKDAEERRGSADESDTTHRSPIDGPTHEGNRTLLEEAEE